MIESNAAGPGQGILESDSLDASQLETADEQLEKKIKTENIKQIRKLDYTLKTPEQRTEYVRKITEQAPPETLTPKYLQILADYIIFAMNKEQRKQKNILTDNRMVTVNKRETSFEGICSNLESGQDGIYNLLSDLGKDTILSPKDPITQIDIDNIPELQELRKSIEKVQQAYKKAKGRQKYLLKKQLIEMRQDQYIIRNYARGTSWAPHSSSTAKMMSTLNLYDDFAFDSKGNPINNGVISFFNPDHIEALLCNYSGLKESAYGHFESDLYYLMVDLDDLIDRTLKYNYPFYYDLLWHKIHGKTNVQIQQLLKEKYGIKHSVEYLSALWRNKIPKLIAEQAQIDYLEWYYTFKERGKWKQCTRCGQVKLAHSKFFSKNRYSKDGFYSICKCCRNAKSKKKKNKLDTI